jgi:hypothetical protein
VEGGCSNAYAYVSGDPVNQEDLRGMFRCAKWLHKGAKFFGFGSLIDGAVDLIGSLMFAEPPLSQGLTGTAAGVAGIGGWKALEKGSLKLGLTRFAAKMASFGRFFGVLSIPASFVDFVCEWIYPSRNQYSAVNARRK